MRNKLKPEPIQLLVLIPVYPTPDHYHPYQTDDNHGKTLLHGRPEDLFEDVQPAIEINDAGDPNTIASRRNVTITVEVKVEQLVKAFKYRCSHCIPRNKVANQLLPPMPDSPKATAHP